MTDLGTLGGQGGSATAINNQAQIVGSAQTADGVYHPYVREGGVMYNLEDVLPAVASVTFRASAINDNGQIVGSGKVGNYYHGFLITDNDGIFANGGATLPDLGTLPGGFSSPAGTINNQGQVAGEASAKTGELHAYLYSGGVMRDIKSLGGPVAYATGINDSAQVVGSSLTQKNTYDDNIHAFIWQDGRMTDLNKFLPRRSSWTLQYGRGISNNGLIVGAGILNGQTHGFLMIPSGTALVAQSTTVEPTAEVLPAQEARPLFTETLSYWQATGADTSPLGTSAIRVTDLPGEFLGMVSGNAPCLERNATGWSWLSDVMLGDNNAFPTPGDQGEQGKIDLLSSLSQEAGHGFSLDCDAQGITDETQIAHRG